MDKNEDVAKITQKLNWEDQFFREEEGLIAVFDLDYEKIIEYDNQVTVAYMLFPPFLILSSLFCWPCIYKTNNVWSAYAKHLAVTRDGIKYVEDKQKTCCGLECQDKGKKSKTVPFDKITDCDVEEPAGSECFCVERVLYTVNVDTASGNRGDDGGSAHELSLVGLKDPENFKKLVWAMKRWYQSGGVAATSLLPTAFPSSISSPPAKTTMDREFATTNNAETNAILREIHQELKQMNRNLETMQKP